MLFYVEQDGPVDLSTPACLQHYKVWRIDGSSNFASPDVI